MATTMAIARAQALAQAQRIRIIALGYESWPAKPKKSAASPKVPAPATAMAPTPAGVVNVPLSQIKTNKSLFQNREDDYSQESVNRIIAAVNAGTFRMEVFDPILLWKQPGTGQLFILSGHSRTEAFRRLAKTDSLFSKIPAKIIAVSEKEAKTIARESNTLATRETDLERAAYYRTLRLEGQSEKQLIELARQNEGKNATYILNLSYLSPKGYLVSQIKSLEAAGESQRANLTVISDWTGQIRRSFPDLTDSHENELALYLVNGGYGTKSHQFSSKQRFMDRIRVVVTRHTVFGQFQKDSPLNLQNAVATGQSEAEYQNQYDQLLKAVTDAEKELKAKSTYAYSQLAEGKVTKKQVDELLQLYTEKYSIARIQLNQLVADRDKYIQGDRAQTQLFGISRYRKQALKNKRMKKVLHNSRNRISKKGLGAVSDIQAYLSNWSKVRHLAPENLIQANRFFELETDNFTNLDSLDGEFTTEFTQHVQAVEKLLKKLGKNDDAYSYGRNFKGKNYSNTKNLDIKEIARLVREELAIEFPGYGFSVTIDRYAGGQSIDVRINKSPKNPFNADYSRFIREGGKPGEYDFDRSRLRTSRDALYTDEFTKVVDKAETILQSYNRDDSDPMTDYFSVRYYGHVSVDQTPLMIQHFPDAKAISDLIRSEQQYKERKEKRDKSAAERKGKFAKGAIVWVSHRVKGNPDMVRTLAIVIKSPNGRAAWSNYNLNEIKPFAQLTAQQQERVLQLRKTYPDSYKPILVGGVDHVQAGYRFERYDEAKLELYQSKKAKKDKATFVPKSRGKKPVPKPAPVATKKDKSRFVPKARGKKPIPTPKKQTMTPTEIKAAYQQLNLSNVPDSIRREIKEIAQATENFSDADLVDVFAPNFTELYQLIQRKHPKAIKTVKASKPAQPARPVAAKPVKKDKATFVPRARGKKPASGQTEKTEAGKTNAGRTKSGNTKAVARLSTEVEFLKKLVNANGKIKSYKSLLLLLRQLQKAIKTQLIRKVSPFAGQIMYMQEKLLELLREAEKKKDGFVKVAIGDAKLTELIGIVGGENVYPSLALIKTYIGMQATMPDRKKVENLINRIAKADLSSDPFADKVANIQKQLKNYLDKPASLPILIAELSGLAGLMGNMLMGSQMQPTHAIQRKGRISAMDMGKITYNKYAFSGRYQSLLGQPAVGFKMMISGEPGIGKSTESMRLARYLAKSFGRVLYVSSEEHGSATLSEKLKQVGGAVAQWDFENDIPKDIGLYQFLFIDSVNKLGFTLDEFEQLSEKYPHLSIIMIFQNTKGGKFKGGKDWEHDVDIVVEGVSHGRLRTTKNRFADLADVQVFG